MIHQPQSGVYGEGIARTMRERGIPALAVITMTSEQILSAEVQGARIAGMDDNPATLYDFFHIGSCGKSVLAVMAGKLVEAGKIDWHSALFSVLPELEAGANPAYSDITLSDLLLCKAGIAAFTAGDDQFPELNPLLPNARLEFARYLVSGEPAAPRLPDGSFSHLYSNASYTVAALILERASGFDWETMVHRTLVDGYEVDVGFGWPNLEDPETQPWGHGVHDGGFRPYPPGDTYGLSSLIAPAGDLSMRPLHYAGYVQQHLRGLRGIDGYVEAETIRHIHQAQRGFSLGVGNGRYYGKSVSQMDGSAGTFYCHSIIAPEQDFAYVMLANAGGPEVVAGIYELSGQVMRSRFRPWWKVWS